MDILNFDMGSFILNTFQSSIQAPLFMIGSYLAIKFMMKRAWS